MLGQSEFDATQLETLFGRSVGSGWIVRQTLASSPYEVTQLVTREGDGSGKQYVRKFFSQDSALGVAYGHVLASQARGVGLCHLPVIVSMSIVDDGLEVVMEQVHGITLRQAVEEQGRCGAAFAVEVGSGLCEALAELHGGMGAPIIHRDLKPGNIMLSEGRVVLIDLGIARIWQEGQPRDTVRLGTPGYAPPEQYGYGQTTVQSDIYAAGMVMAYCLIGEDPAPSLRESGFEDVRIPAAFRPLLAKATALDPAQRFADAAAMYAAVQHAAAGEYRAYAGGKRQDSQVAYGHVELPQRLDTRRAGGGRKPKFDAFSHVVGGVWNVLLVCSWLLLVIASVGASVMNSTETLMQAPLWFRLIAYGGMLVVPAGAVIYLLYDKRRLRERFPALKRCSWKRDLPVCLAITLAVFLAVAVLYYFFFR